MKKEIFIGCFLLVLLAAALVNIYFLNKLTDNVTHLIEESEKSAEEKDWDKAEKKAEEAARLWADSDTYTHLVLRHPEVESATDAIYAFMAEIYGREEGTAKGAAQAAISRMKSISSIEQIKFGSIF
jgi:TRAP-type C4-dicarboxylate transport system substrate-binding protein